MPILAVLMTNFIRSIRSPRDKSWFDNVDAHVEAANRIIERFVIVETRVKGFDKEFQELKESIRSVESKLDRLIDRLLNG